MGWVMYRSISCILIVCILAFNLCFVYFPFHGTALLGSHYYGNNGLLVVNPNGPHPIFELTEQAEKVWMKKLDRASQSLDEAVAEYKRRYHRYPPLHFEKWYVGH